MVNKNLPSSTCVVMAIILFLLFCLSFMPSCINKEYAVVENYTYTEYRFDYDSKAQNDRQQAPLTDRSENLVYELIPSYQWNSRDILFKDRGNVWYYGYDLPDSDTDGMNLKISIWPQLQYEPMTISVFDMTQAGHLEHPDAMGPTGTLEKGMIEWKWITGLSTRLWLDRANEQMNHARFLAGRSNLWSKPADPQVIEINVSRARRIAVIICGPEYKWNGKITAAAMAATIKSDNQQVRKDNDGYHPVPYEVQEQRLTNRFKQIPIWEALFQP